jgi:hypothetical protein
MDVDLWSLLDSVNSKVYSPVVQMTTHQEVSVGGTV